jgi:hypothetical protein
MSAFTSIFLDYAAIRRTGETEKTECIIAIAKRGLRDKH